MPYDLLCFHTPCTSSPSPLTFGLFLLLYCRSYVFRLSAPKSVITSPAPSNGTSQKGPTGSGGERSKANGAATNPSPDKGNTPKAPKTSSTMLPPPGGRALKRNGKTGVDRPSEKWAQPKPVVGGRKAKSPSPSSDVDAEQEAMLKANVPSSFGAARDKPLGKRAEREAHIVRGVPGAVISGTSGRFATGRSRGSDKNGKAGPSGAGEGAVDKEEARRQKQAEIAAITAELVRADAGDAAEKGDGEDGNGGGSGSGSGPPVQFKPGGWRHASGNGKMMMTSAGRKKSQRTGAGAAAERSRREEEEEEEEEEEPEEEDDEEEEITEEMRIKLVVRRLGLPVSHEVQLSGHRKGVTALALDRAGGRVATGSNDYKVREYAYYKLTFS